MTAEKHQQIANQYYESLEKPALAQKTPKFCIMAIGLMRSGKTTTIKKICNHLPLVRFSVDEIRQALNAEGIDLNQEEVEAISVIVIKRLANEGYNIAFDTDMARPEKRQKLHDFMKTKYKEFWIRVVAPENIIMNRLTEQRSELPWFSDDPGRALRVYEKRKEVHKQPGNLDSIKYDYVFDTSKNNLDEQVADFVNLVIKEMKLHVDTR